ncbi:hypothetical protein [Sphingomonas sp. FARSPH]|uniref:hypothetical protein n=1 Tax=Sphingomonas sp. FARSPH TaxID=2219696 RepID=UPI000E1091C0|nr:hypothetical protein [Sphingomonas sp. FARSPH]AXJ97494.1 hypothetical protein DM480_17575 [Sphingomonas sp. FARSPH]
MLTEARYAYNENSTQIVLYVLLAQLGVVLIGGAMHVAAWVLGADVGLFDTPQLLASVRPLMCAMLLPGIGWALGVVASWGLGDGSDDADPYRVAGNALGQLACLVALPGSMAG